jgi:hypothetical protein
LVAICRPSGSRRTFIPRRWWIDGRHAGLRRVLARPNQPAQMTTGRHQCSAQFPKIAVPISAKSLPASPRRQPGRQATRSHTALGQFPSPNFAAGGGRCSPEKPVAVAGWTWRRPRAAADMPPHQVCASVGQGTSRAPACSACPCSRAPFGATGRWCILILELPAGPDVVRFVPSAAMLCREIVMNRSVSAPPAASRISEAAALTSGHTRQIQRDGRKCSSMTNPEEEQQCAC